MKSIFEKNVDLFHELVPESWWAVEMWQNDCFALNYRFTVSETYRTQDRQDRLFLIDRDTPDEMWRSYQYGEITLADARRGVELLKTKKPLVYAERPVTWTLNSNHTKRIAMDIYPINCTHADIQSVAAKYGITHPIPKDPPHYEVDKVKRRPEPRIPATTSEAIRKLERQLKTTKPGPSYNRLKARLESLKTAVGHPVK